MNAAQAVTAPRMTRLYAVKRLLEHGPLTARELLAITGWPRKTVSSITQRLTQRGTVKPLHLPGHNRYAYALAANHLPTHPTETTSP